MLFTIGYESATLEDFLATLKNAGVSLLLDVREFPGSRKRGFSKNALASSLAANGIQYLHLRGLGDPKLGRDAARAGDFELFRRIFLQHMTTEKAQSDLQRAADLLKKKRRICLMCYERDPATCHRSMVADMLSSAEGITIHHLFVGAACRSQEKLAL